jgi:hypothetical protein
MDGTCNTRRGYEVCMHVKFWSDTSRDVNHRNILAWVYDIETDLRNLGCEGEDWFALSQDVIQWRNFVNTVLNNQVL